MIRIAAVGDIHVGPDTAEGFGQQLSHLPEKADVFLMTGDLTRAGDPADARLLADHLKKLALPKVAVLGNHDYHMDREQQIVETLEDCGVTVLEGESTVVSVGETVLGIAGAKGFGGGYAAACATEFGEPQMKQFVGHTRQIASGLEAALKGLEGKVNLKVALLHYSPVEATLRGEKREIYPFLGSYLLAEAIDRGGADVVFHGHSHAGKEKAITPGGIHVRNVAQPVIQHSYNVYCLDSSNRSLQQSAVGAEGNC